MIILRIGRTFDGKDNLCDTPILSLPDGSKEFVVYYDASNQGLVCTHAKRQGRERDNRNAAWPGPTNGKEGRWREKLKAASDCQKSYVDNMRKHLEWKLVIKVDVRIIILLTSTKYLADTNLHVHLEEIKVDKTLCFVEEPVEIIEREVKSLKRSRNPIVKSIGTRSEDGRCSCSVNVILRLELYAAFCTLVMGQAKSFISRDEIFPKGGDTVDNCAFERLVTVSIDLE
ncbi:hypothetical protein Tco_0218492 [Tanacetum coccineum]